MFYTWKGPINRYVAHLSWPSPTRNMSSRMMLGWWSMAKPSMWPNGSPSILEENKPSWHTSERTGQRPFFFVFVLVASSWLGRTQLIKLDVKGKWRILNPKAYCNCFWLWSYLRQKRTLDQCRTNGLRWNDLSCIPLSSCYTPLHHFSYFPYFSKLLCHNK